MEQIYKISLLNILMIFGIKEKSIIWPIQCIVAYCYKYNRATYDWWFCGPGSHFLLSINEKSNENSGERIVLFHLHSYEAFNASYRSIFLSRDFFLHLMKRVNSFSSHKRFWQVNQSHFQYERNWAGKQHNDRTVFLKNHMSDRAIITNTTHCRHLPAEVETETKSLWTNQWTGSEDLSHWDESNASALLSIGR